VEWTDEARINRDTSSYIQCNSDAFKLVI
ncbi:hypothetical protein Pcinc_041230, partial [Petrolisthes cinctipes]